MSSTTTSSAIGSDDIKWWDGVNDTFTRQTSTGGLLTLNALFADAVDVLEAYGGGTAYTLASINSAKSAIGSTSKRALKFRPGTWTVTDDLTLTVNLSVVPSPGSLLSVSSGKTLTINGPILAGPYQIFSGDGTVAINGEANPEIYPEWWGWSTAGSAADNNTALQAAISSLSTSGGTIRFSPGTYQMNTVNLPAKVNLQGAGVDVTILDARGTDTTFVGTGAWYHAFFKDFSVTHANNTSGSGIDFFDAKLGATSCIWENLRLTCKNGVTTNGITVRGVDPGTSNANNHQYNNIFLGVRTDKSGATAATGKALYLWGQDVANARCNANRIIGGVYDGFATAIYINGNGNYLANPTVNGATTAGIHLYGNSTIRNVIMGAYLDAGITGDKIKLESTTAGVSNMATIIETVAAYADIVCSGTSATPTFTLIKENLYPGAESTTSLIAMEGGMVHPGFADDKHFRYAGARVSENGGYFWAAGPDYAGGINGLSDAGGASVVIRNNASAQFRVVKKTDDTSTFTRLMTIDSAGKAAIGSLTPTLSTTNGLDIQGSDTSLRLRGSKTPANASDTGNQGEICWDSTYLYVCIATNTWKRVQIDTW